MRLIIFYVFLNMQKPLILVTNDDGITAPGIRYLIDIMKELGDVVVVAPELSSCTALAKSPLLNSGRKIGRASCRERV